MKLALHRWASRTFYLLWPFPRGCGRGFAAPPVRAIEVWLLLPIELQVHCRPDTLVAAMYQRLPMGFTHSVHLLMNINMRHVGIVLLASSTSQTNIPLRETAEVVQQETQDIKSLSQLADDSSLSDESWHGLRAGRKSADTERTAGRNQVLEDFCYKLRAAKIFLRVLSPYALPLQGREELGIYRNGLKLSQQLIKSLCWNFPLIWELIGFGSSRIQNVFTCYFL